MFPHECKQQKYANWPYVEASASIYLSFHFCTKWLRSRGEGGFWRLLEDEVTWQNTEKREEIPGQLERMYPL